MLIVTYSCNLRCTYCYEPKVSTSQMSEENAREYITRTVESLGDEYSEFELQFMGGEPLLSYPLIRSLSEWIWSTPFKVKPVTLFAATNGTLLNEEMKNWFSENKERICLGLSYDGNKAMQDTNRSQSSRNVDLEYFVRTWPEQSVKMTISPHTVGTFSAGVKDLHERGFKNISAELAQGKFVKWEQHHLNELHKQLSSLVEFYIEHSEIPPVSMLQLNTAALNYDGTQCKRCSCGEDMVCIDTDGTEYACHMFSPVATTKERAAQSHSINFDDYEALTPEPCKNCSLQDFCTNCYGMGYSYYEDIAFVSPFICSATKIKFLNACSLALQHKETDRATKEQISEILKEFK